MLEEEEEKPLEKSCSEFGLFLNVSGAAEAVSNALLDLFLLNERPELAVEYVRENLDAHLNRELARLAEAVVVARAELEGLREEVLQERKKGIMAQESDDSNNDDGQSVGTLGDDDDKSRDDGTDDSLSISTMGTIKSEVEPAEETK